MILTLMNTIGAISHGLLNGEQTLQIHGAHVVLESHKGFYMFEQRLNAELNQIILTLFLHFGQIATRKTSLPMSMESPSVPEDHSQLTQQLNGLGTLQEVETVQDIAWDIIGILKLHQIPNTIMFGPLTLKPGMIFRVLISPVQIDYCM